MSALADPLLEALWKNVLDRWEDDAPHAVFLEHCQRTGRLAEAAARYRGMKGDHARGAGAEKRLQGVAALALLALEASRTPPRETAGQTSYLVLTVLFLAATIALALFLTTR